MKRENMNEAIRLECSKHADIGEAMRWLLARPLRAIAGKRRRHRGKEGGK